MATYTWDNIHLGNGLLPDGTKLLTGPMLTYHEMCFVAFAWEQFHKKYSWS